MGNKKPWESKTLWANLLLAVVAFVPAVKDVVAHYPDMIVWVLSAVNVVLRLVTHGKVALED